MKPMNMMELVALVAKDTGVSQAIAKRVIYKTFGTIMRRVSWKQPVKIFGFGTFKSANRPARIGRNPQTGSPIRIPFRIRPVFTPSSHFNELIDLANGKLYMTLEDKYIEELSGIAKHSDD